MLLNKRQRKALNVLSVIVTIVVALGMILLYMPGFF